MSGTLGVICNDNARYSLFAIRLSQLLHPPNTALDWSVTSDRIIGRNTLAEKALERGSEWLMFVDDDHVFPADILLRLLEHDVPVVGALYMQRQVPFRPIAYASKDDLGRYHSIHLSDYEPEELVPVRSLGTGGMLIRSEVLREMRDAYPDRRWFEHGSASEDHIFCDKCDELGIPVHVDLGARMGHMTSTAIWPSNDEELGWAVGFTVADQFSMKAPIAPKDELVEDETVLASA